MMRELVHWQRMQPNVDAEIVVFAPEHQRQKYAQRAVEDSLPVRFFSTPARRFSYLAILFDRHLTRLLQELESNESSACFVVHFHNANLSGVFVPLAHRKDRKLALVATFHGAPLVYPKPNKPKLWLHRFSVIG